MHPLFPLLSTLGESFISRKEGPKSLEVIESCPVFKEMLLMGSFQELSKLCSCWDSRAVTGCCRSPLRRWQERGQSACTRQPCLSSFIQHRGKRNSKLLGRCPLRKWSENHSSGALLVLLLTCHQFWQRIAPLHFQTEKHWLGFLLHPSFHVIFSLGCYERKKIYILFLQALYIQ